MRIVRDAYVVLDYVLYLPDSEGGEVIEATDDEGGRPIGFVHGYSSLVPGLEDSIVGMAAGETKEITVAPEQGYGAHDEALEHWVDRSDFPPDVAIDDEFEAEDEAGEQITLRVVEVAEDALLVDGNHPLAGETLRFEVMIRSVRPATAAELADVRRFSQKTRLPLVQAGGTAPEQERLTKKPAPAIPAELDDEQ